MCTFLHKRDGAYYFRRAIPVRLRSAFGGRREWVISLKTKDPSTAKKLIPHYTIAFDAALGRAIEGSGGNVVCDFRLTDPSKCAVLPLVDNITAKLTSGQPASSRSLDLLPPLPLLATFEAYAIEQRIKPGTAAEWRSMLTALTKFVGYDDAARLSVDDLDRWRDALLSEPTRRGTLRDPGTVKDKYLCAIRATLGWAVEKRKLTENVAKKVIVRVPKKAKLRSRDFTTAEANTILSASMREHKGLLSDHGALARRWIPWLCAYTGARVNEISQLRGSDVALIDDIWTIRITPEAGTVKANIARIVPLHPHLVEQGFPLVARTAKSQPIFYDPSRIKCNLEGNRYFKKVGERLRDWVRAEVGIRDPDVQPNHGWRHTFKTLMVEAGVPERVSDALQGHAPRTVGQSYGSVPLRTLAKAVNAIPRFNVVEYK